MTKEIDLKCPQCGRLNERHDGATPNSKPSEGSISICWKCSGIGIFAMTNGALEIRLPSAEEQAELEAHPQIRAARAVIMESYTPDQAVSLWRGNETQVDI